MVLHWQPALVHRTSHTSSAQFGASLNSGSPPQNGQGNRSVTSVLLAKPFSAEFGYHNERGRVAADDLGKAKLLKLSALRLGALNGDRPRRSF
jgi:hypothetical protein